MRGSRTTHIERTLAELRREREQIAEGIRALELLFRGRVRPRGKPPAWLSEIRKVGESKGKTTKPASLQRTGEAGR